MTTIWIAHITFTWRSSRWSCSRACAQMDDSLEEAAMDLGARPFKVFFLITLPIIAPALVSGWLLAFTLSLDDLVIASFVAGPGSTTLPMVIFSKVRLGVSPDINALATIMVADRGHRRGHHRLPHVPAAEDPGPRRADGARGEPADDRQPEEVACVAARPLAQHCLAACRMP